MKRLLSLIIMAAALAVGTDSFAGTVPAFGVSAQGAYFNGQENHGNGVWSGGYGYGGGLVFETMFTGLLGVQSGLTCMYNEVNTTMSDQFGNSVDIRISFVRLEVPLFFMVSLNSGDFSLVFLSGITLSQTVASEITATSPAGEEVSADAMPYLSSFNAGVTAGVLCKFRVTAYTDFYFGSTATFFFTDLFEREDGNIVHLFDVRGVMGYLFRTDIFPPAANQ